MHCASIRPSSTLHQASVVNNTCHSPRVKYHAAHCSRQTGQGRQDYPSQLLAITLKATTINLHSRSQHQYFYQCTDVRIQSPPYSNWPPPAPVAAFPWHYTGTASRYDSYYRHTLPRLYPAIVSSPGDLVALSRHLMLVSFDPTNARQPRARVRLPHALVSIFVRQTRLLSKQTVRVSPRQCTCVRYSTTCPPVSTT
jgi:hypothetical protein